MFKIKSHRSYKQKVQLELRNDAGGVDRPEIVCEFRVFPRSQAKEDTREILDAVLVGVEGIQAEGPEGEALDPVEFIKDDPVLTVQIARAWREGLEKHSARGN